MTGVVYTVLPVYILYQYRFAQGTVVPDSLQAPNLIACNWLDIIVIINQQAISIGNERKEFYLLFSVCDDAVWAVLNLNTPPGQQLGLRLVLGLRLRHAWSSCYGTGTMLQY